jgi:hypothetical protein
MTSISREEAVSALQQIGEAREKVTLMQRYRNAAPFLILWGAIWVVADTLCDFFPEHVALIWNTAAPSGAAISFLIGQRFRGDCSTASWRTHNGRWGATILTFFGYFTAAQAVLPQLTPLQCSAWISLFFAFVYMWMGIWVGWRIFGVGLALAALILFGYFGLTSHYFLWLGLVSGGALIAGGLWLRQVV